MSRPATPPKPDPKSVRCADCIFFRRDTEGRNKRNGTEEYFMGECALGHTPDGCPKKVFADRWRECNDHQNR